MKRSWPSILGILVALGLSACGTTRSRPQARDDEPRSDRAKPSVGAKTVGIASYYGKRFHGRRTASGERFDMRAMTAAHPSLPFGTRLRVTLLKTGKSVVVRVNDRGPHTGDRIIDLSQSAAAEIGLVRAGLGKVEVEVLTRS